MNCIKALSLFLAATGLSLGHGQTQESPLHHRKLLDHDQDPTAIIDSEYIVKFSEAKFSLRSADVATTILSLIHQRANGTAEVLYTFNNVFKGAAIRGLPRQKMIGLLSSDLIEYATPNKMVKVSGISQSSPIWNLDRIDQAEYPLNKAYTYNYTGRNVNVFILDSGIRTTHSEFRGTRGRSRATCGFNAFKTTEDCTDLQGHGTHVAATVGGRTYGVAKDVLLTNVKVLDKNGDGTYAGVIAGVDYVVGRKRRTPSKPMVINMSLGGPKDTAVNAAVDAAVDAGIFVAVAAGNSGDDACSYSPASATKPVTVGATAENTFVWDDDFFNFPNNDYVSDFSCQGKCVDIFAPGTDIVSASFECDTCSVSFQGTSMASPHVAGVAALYLQRSPSLKPAQIEMALKREAVKDNIDTMFLDPESPNLLLKVNIP